MTRSRIIRFEDGGIMHTLTLPDVEARGVIAIGCWVKPSRIPGTWPWEWVIYNMPVTAVTGMSAGYNLTRWGAKRAARRALRFWQSYGYQVEWDGAR